MSARAVNINTRSPVSEGYSTDRRGHYGYEKKILYAYACPSHHNTVTRLKWLTALTVDPEAKGQMLHLTRKIENQRVLLVNSPPK